MEFVNKTNKSLFPPFPTPPPSQKYPFGNMTILPRLLCAMQTILAIFCNLTFHGRSFAILKVLFVAPDAIFTFSEILRQRLWPTSV